MFSTQHSPILDFYPIEMHTEMSHYLVSKFANIVGKSYLSAIYFLFHSCEDVHVLYSVLAWQCLTACHFQKEVLRLTRFLLLQSHLSKLTRRF